jgi:hypothetical protein
MLNNFPRLGYQALRRLLRGGGIVDCWKSVILWRDLVNPPGLPGTIPPLDIRRFGFFDCLGVPWLDEVHEGGWLWR